MELIEAILKGVKGLSLLTIAVLLSATALLVTIYAIRRIIRGSFGRDRYMGLSSETFDLTDNIEGGDTRRGLNFKAKSIILFLMMWYGDSFDEARSRYVQRAFATNNIGPDGRPRDPKAIFFD